MAVNNAGLQIRNLLASLSPAKKISLAVMIIGTIAGFVLLMTWTGKPDFRNLYANLAPEDAGEILNYLKEQNIPYRVTENGAGIEVPRDRVHECHWPRRGCPKAAGSGSRFSTTPSSA
jgi:flagellar M-ring protein FliF